MVFLDTSALISSLSEARRNWAPLRRLLEAGERLCLCSLVLYEWQRGPRSPAELQLRQHLFPDTGIVAFEHQDALLSASLYQRLPRARARATDLAVAACALRHNATLWTLNQADFADIPGLRLVNP